MDGWNTNMNCRNISKCFPPWASFSPLLSWDRLLWFALYATNPIQSCRHGSISTLVGKAEERSPDESTAAGERSTEQWWNQGEIQELWAMKSIDMWEEHTQTVPTLREKGTGFCTLFSSKGWMYKEGCNHHTLRGTSTHTPLIRNAPQYLTFLMLLSIKRRPVCC